MKSPYLLSAITALIGFSVAWIAKPGAAPQVEPSAQVADSAAPRQPRTQARPRSAADSKRPAEVRASDFPLAEQAEQGPQNREEAKMLRLAEALDLTIEQQGEIIQLVEQVQATATDAVPVIEDLATRGKAIEDGLAKLLAPEQFAKFQELRERERDNRIELRSQRMLTQAIEDIDLSPEQREEVMSRLRLKSKAEMQSIPAAATLLFDKSMLPTGKKELSVDGILLLAQLEQPIDASDPVAAHERVINRQKQDLEEILRCFDGILTPGQMGQYQAALAETRKIMGDMRTQAPQEFGN
jgi:uncharacterized protein YjiS (DUF1127 family)